MKNLHDPFSPYRKTLSRKDYVLLLENALYRSGLKETDRFAESIGGAAEVCGFVAQDLAATFEDCGEGDQ